MPLYWGRSPHTDTQVVPEEEGRMRFHIKREERKLDTGLTEEAEN